MGENCETKGRGVGYGLGNARGNEVGEFVAFRGRGKDHVKGSKGEGQVRVDGRVKEIPFEGGAGSIPPSELSCEAQGGCSAKEPVEWWAGERIIAGRPGRVKGNIG